MGDQIITLELRQETASNVNSPGDFRTILNTPITIEENDEISIVKSFIDTTSQIETSINIKNDVIMEFEFYKWINNIFLDGKSAPGTDVKLDGMKHIACNKIDHPGGLPGFEIIDSIVVTLFDDSTLAVGGITIIFDYTDDQNFPRAINIWIPRTELNDFTNYLEVPVGVIVKTGSFISSPRNNALVINSEPYNTAYSTNVVPKPQKYDIGLNSGIVVSPVSGSASYTPISYKKQIYINKGNYTPEQLADKITTLMTSNLQKAISPASPGNSGVDNSLLTSSKGDTKTYVNTESSYANSPSQVGVGFVFSGTTFVWVGSSQFALEYDTVSSRFLFKDIHTPIYIGGNKCLLMADSGTDAELYPACAYSGIAFKNITVTDTKTKLEIRNFFLDNMGINPDLLRPEITYVSSTVLTEISNVPNFRWLEGINFTQGFNSIDAGVDKDFGDDALADVSKFSIVSSAVNTATIIGDSTSSIFGDNIFSTDSTFGYFKIELNTTFKSLLVGQDIIQRNIMAIVGKYYESNSYTSGEEGIPYVHVGTPVQLSAIGVRILNSDNKVPANIENDNTVFLRIRKAEQPQKKITA